ncbi:MAG: SRPBCC family protein [Aestuariivirga sp.]
MARAYASRIIKAPVQVVWSVVRDFNGLPGWAAGIVDSKIEDGLDADVVGCVRSFHTVDGSHIRERLLMLDDAHHCFSYNFEKPAFPVKHYLATMRLMPVTHGDATFIEWEATFDEAPGDEGKYVEIISNQVFAAGLKSVDAKIKHEKIKLPAGSERWKAWAPNKV